MIVCENCNKEVELFDHDVRRFQDEFEGKEVSKEEYIKRNQIALYEKLAEVCSTEYEDIIKAFADSDNITLTE